MDKIRQHLEDALYIFRAKAHLRICLIKNMSASIIKTLFQAFFNLPEFKNSGDKRLQRIIKAAPGSVASRRRRLIKASDFECRQIARILSLYV
jgi:hypothetical protein